MVKIFKVNANGLTDYKYIPPKKLLNVFIAVMFIVVFFLTSPLLMASSLDSRQSQLLLNNCVQCHSQAETGAPVMGVESDWVDIKAKGEDLMLKNVIQGIRGMPPLGYCSACSKDDLRMLIRLMTNTLEQKRVK